jgi:hypothetical protein
MLYSRQTNIIIHECNVIALPTECRERDADWMEDGKMFIANNITFMS